MHQIGKIIKKLGLKGEILIDLPNAHVDKIQIGAPLFIGSHQNQIPYFVQKLEITNQIKLKLEDINTPEEVIPLHNKLIFTQDTTILKNPTSKADFKAFIGFQAVDENDKPIGKIVRIENFPQQIMAFLDFNGKEIMVPLIESFIGWIDPEKAVVQFILPEGILEL